MYPRVKHPKEIVVVAGKRYGGVIGKRVVLRKPDMNSLCLETVGSDDDPI